MDFPISITHKHLTIKLYNWMDYPEHESARNVEAYDSNGDLVWVIAALGGNSRTDCYTNVSSDGKVLRAFNYQCYDCVIDEDTGEVLSSSFTK